LIFEALGLEKLKPKVARLRLDVCWLVPSLLIAYGFHIDTFLGALCAEIGLICCERKIITKYLLELFDKKVRNISLLNKYLNPYLNPSLGISDFHQAGMKGFAAVGSLAYSSIFPTTSVMINWHQNQLAYIKDQWFVIFLE
jgi:hypothetical protein